MSVGLCLGEKIFQFLHPVPDSIGEKRGQGMEKLTGLVYFQFLSSPVCSVPPPPSHFSPSLVLHRWGCSGLWRP